MVKVLSEHFITGACHAPVDSETRRMLVRCSRELTGVEENFQKGALIQGAPAETVDERRLAQ
ncbi:MAG: hypothetical protein ACLTST_01840 [Lachnospiraceae bacterium]